MRTTKVQTFPTLAGAIDAASWLRRVGVPVYIRSRTFQRRAFVSRTGKRHRRLFAVVARVNV